MNEIKYYNLPESHPLSDLVVGFGIRQTGGSEEVCNIDFEVYEIVNYEPQTYLKGNVKWDGCINYTYTKGDYYSYHVCSPEQAQAEMLLIMSMAYQLAIRCMPTKHDRLEHTPLVEVGLNDDPF